MKPLSRQALKILAREEARAYESEPGMAPAPSEEMVRITGPEDVYSLLAPMAQWKREHFGILLLNARHEVTHFVTVSIGSLNASIVHPREVYRPAILFGAAAIIAIHNHPSGDPEPSQEDLDITKRLTQVGEMLGIPLLDHVIIARKGMVSLKTRGLIADVNSRAYTHQAFITK